MSGKKIAPNEIYALAFGLFLGLCLWKFGNPVILDQKIFPPDSLSDILDNSWPTHWANWVFLPLAIIGALLAFKYQSSNRPTTKWLWLLPLLWFGWQIISATQTVDANLTSMTFWQLFGCLACYFLGAFRFRPQFSGSKFCCSSSEFLPSFAFCLVRAVDQKLVEFPQSQQMLIEGERIGWTNVPPEMFLEMKQEHSYHHHQWCGCRKSCCACQIFQRPRHGHAGLSKRTGRNYFAVTAVIANTCIFKKTSADDSRNRQSL